VTATEGSQAVVSTLQWIGLVLGLLVVLIGLPAVIWPGPTGERVLALMARRGVLRSWGVFLLIVAVAIALATAEPVSLFEWVMLIVAMGMAIGASIDLLSPESSRSLAAQYFKKEDLLRFSSGVGVVFGCWLIYLSLTA
jgi:hypothetical protein